MMKRILRISPAALLCAASLFLCGCGASGAHEKAIENAIVSYPDYYIEVRSLSEQVRSQYDDSGESTAEYTITADIPYYPSLDENAVSFAPPAPDYTRSTSQYRRNARLLLRQELEAYALGHELPSYVEIALTFTVYRIGTDWESALSGTSKTLIQQTVDSMIDEILGSSEAYVENVVRTEIAGAKDALLESVFGGADYVSLVTVTDVTGGSDGLYTLKLSFPDPVSVYSALAEHYYASYNRLFYGDAVSVSLQTDDLSGVDISGTAYITDTAVILRDVDGVCTLYEAPSLEANIASAKAAAEGTAAARINAEWRVPEQEIPSSGAILEGESRGNDIVFVTSADLGKYFYVRFYLLPGEDVGAEGELAAGVFIFGGKEATVRLPSGYYRIDCYAGDTWYGPDALFGDNGEKFGSDSAIRSRSGYVNTISFG
jgi:hypothetical protein